MKPENIENMQAGREMDALVAENIFKLDAACWIHGCEITAHRIPEYSTDIAAAWLVVEKLRQQGFRIMVSTDDELEWGAYFEDRRHSSGSSEHDSAPLAICRAALKAVSRQQDEPKNLTELFHSRLTNRGKQTLAHQAIEHLEAQENEK
jgi:hypothetical protein